MSKRKKQSKENKFLLETSTQYGKFMPDNDPPLLEKIPKNASLYSSYFVLYEFKVGLIKNLIDFYLSVSLIDDPAKAIASWSRRFSKREVKNKVILEALMAKLYNSIQTGNKKKYLRQIEAVIFFLLSNFDTEIKSMVGDFGSDPLVKHSIMSNKDFGQFIDTYNSRKCIPLDKFWEKNITSLKQLLSEKDRFDKSKVIEKFYSKLQEIEKDLSNANKFNINKSIGDVVISVDTPASITIATIDKSFGELCPILEKNSEYLI